MVMSSNGWYESITNDSLEQGDLVQGVRVIVPDIKILNGITKEAPAEIYDVAILTQSCDLSNKKTPWIHVTPVTPLHVMQSQFQEFNNLNNLESIRMGYQHKYHMLADCDINKLANKILILDFRNVFSLPYAYVMSMVQEGSERLRLRSPYKESLGQAYAKFYMRVGLPQDIPRFVVK